MGANLVAMLAEQIQRHVVGPGDVRGLELSRGTDVQDTGRVS